MRHIPALLAQEIRSHLFAPATYAAAVLFLLFMATLYVLGLADAAKEPREVPPTETFLQLFWIPVWFMVPMLTMRTLAEERRMGTLETLLSSPVSPMEVVIAKVLGAYCLYCLLWLGTLLFPVVVMWTAPALAAEAQFFEPAPLLGGYGFIALSGLMYTAAGVFSSSLTRSQLIAAMLSFCLIFAFTVGARLLTQTQFLQGAELNHLSAAPDYLQTFRHLEDFTRGIVDSRPVFFYGINTVLLIGLTTLLVRRNP